MNPLFIYLFIFTSFSFLSFALPFFFLSFAHSLAADTLKSMETEPEKHGYNKDGLVGDSEVAFSSWLDCKELRGKPWSCKRMVGG